MRVLDVMFAADTLESARQMLRTGRARDIRAEQACADNCQRACALLLAAINRECPPIRIEPEPAAQATDEAARKAGL